jgi:hypothetical protein
MGVVAGLIVAGGTAAAGAYQNKKNREANAQARGESMEDYQARLDQAADSARILEKEYNELIKSRPNVSWESFVRNKIKAIDDPELRRFYDEAKEEDFNRMREFAKIASSDNTDNLMEAADRLSGGDGAFAAAIKRRNDLVLNTDAAGRFARSYELAAPIRTGATTTKYDSQGNLVEGQRSDKQAFSIANEVQTAVEQEQKSDLASLERDRISAAASQVEKARGFLSFYDPTGFASNIDDTRMAAEMDYQSADEQRAFQMYSMFANAASGISPTTPTYADPNAGNELIAAGIKSGSDAIGSYYSNRQKQPTAASTTASNPYSGT